MLRRILFITIMATLMSAPSWADIKFTKLSENQFIVHHRKLTVLGAEAKAMKTAVEEAASLCIAANYSHMEIKDQNVGERIHGDAFGGGRGASADLRIKLYDTPDEETIEEKDLLECEPLADPKKIKIAKKKLARTEK